MGDLAIMKQLIFVAQTAVVALIQMLIRVSGRYPLQNALPDLQANVGDLEGCIWRVRWKLLTKCTM